MIRYIDADALLSKLPDDLPYKASVKRVLMQSPTADVVEVRHGHWITRNIRGIEIEVKCSVCGSKDFYPADYKNIRYTDFCGDCGAKMDGERRSENEG